MWDVLVLTSLVSMCLGAPTPPDVTDKLPLLMPGVTTAARDTYLCMDTKLSNSPTYIVGFNPKAKKEIAHHILLYGCTEPGSRDEIWSCGEMSHTGGDYKSGPVCGSGSQIIYAWAMDAPELKLPPDVAFKVGGNTAIKHLVLQVHYKNEISDPDNSGIVLTTTKEATPNRAGVLLMGTGGAIMPHSIEYMETACEINADQVLHPFAFRTHTHTLGQVVSGYRIRDGKWMEIGRKSPKLPQMFYNTSNPGMDVKNGDIVAARCTMKNDLNRKVEIGPTQEHEMCNFYMMYYVNGDHLPDQTYCFSPGPSYYYWNTSPMRARMNLGQQPDDVSKVPGTSKAIEKTPGSMGSLANEENQIDMLLDSRPRGLTNQNARSPTNQNARIEQLLDLMNSVYYPQDKLYESEFY